MFTVLSFAELGSWDDVKMNGRAALEEYDEFLKELPDSKRVSDLLEIANDKHRYNCMLEFTRLHICLLSIEQATYPTAS